MPSKDSDQPVHSCSLIRIFNGCILDCEDCKVSFIMQMSFRSVWSEWSMGAFWIAKNAFSSCRHWTLWSDCVEVWAHLSLCLTHDRKYIFSRHSPYVFIDTKKNINPFWLKMTLIWSCHVLSNTYANLIWILEWVPASIMPPSDTVIWTWNQARITISWSETHANVY